MSCFHYTTIVMLMLVQDVCETLDLYAMKRILIASYFVHKVGGVNHF